MALIAILGERLTPVGRQTARADDFQDRLGKHCV